MNIEINNNDNDNDRNKQYIFAGIILAIYGDIMGYHNSIWEFNYNLNINNINDVPSIHYKIIEEYIALGSLHNFPIDNYNYSDDTILIIETLKVLNKNYQKSNIDIINKFKIKYIEVLPILLETDSNGNSLRSPGNTTIESIKILQKNKYPLFNKLLGGCGASMRTMPIGIYFYDDLEKLIYISIFNSKLTHNYSLGYFGGLANAYFSSLAIKKIDPWKWNQMFIDLLESKILINIFKKNNIIDEYNQNIEYILDYFRLYQENYLRFFPDIKNYNIKFSELINDFSPQIKNGFKYDFSKVGANGIDSIIFAYDALLSCIIKNNNNINLEDKNTYKWSFEKCLIYSCFHVGDSDTIGSISLGWFGLLFGIPSNLNNYKNIKNFGQFKSYILEIKKKIL